MLKKNNLEQSYFTKNVMQYTMSFFYDKHALRHAVY